MPSYASNPRRRAEELHVPLGHGAPAAGQQVLEGLGLLDALNGTRGTRTPKPQAPEQEGNAGLASQLREVAASKRSPSNAGFREKEENKAR